MTPYKNFLLSNYWKYVALWSGTLCQGKNVLLSAPNIKSLRDKLLRKTFMTEPQKFSQTKQVFLLFVLCLTPWLSCPVKVGLSPSKKIIFLFAAMIALQKL